jgi:hypothetical protein
VKEPGGNPEIVAVGYEPISPSKSVLPELVIPAAASTANPEAVLRSTDICARLLFEVNNNIAIIVKEKIIFIFNSSL